MLHRKNAICIQSLKAFPRRACNPLYALKETGFHLKNQPGFWLRKIYFHIDMDDKNRQQHLNASLTKDTQHARLLAIDFSTDPELLRQLAVSSDPALRVAVAANPNTPPDVLLKLGAEFPAQLLDNPVFSLLLLENLNLVEEIPLPTLRSILRQENVPLYILEKAADKADLQVQQALATNVQTPREVLQRLTQSRNAEVKQAAQLHINLAGELAEEVYEEKAKEVIQAIIPDGYKADTRSLAVLVQLCAIPEFIVEHWLQKSSYNDFVCRVIAYSPATPPKLLKYLAQHRDRYKPHGVAQNPKTPPEILRDLVIEQQENYVRFLVAGNSSTPIDVLEKLSQDKDKVVRLEVAQHPNVPLSLLKELASDRDREVAETATKLMKEKLGEYDVAALREPKTPSWVVEKLAKQTPENAARHPNAPIDLLLEFSTSKDRNLRKAVAENPHAPVSILEQLARDDSFEVRREVARNPKTSIEVLLKQLARDTRAISAVVNRMSAKGYDPESIYDLLAEESTSPLEIILQRLANEGGMGARRFLAQCWDVPISLLEQLAPATESDIRHAVAQNPNTPASCLEQLAGAKEPKVRQAVAQNPNTPITTLETLAKDENSLVRTSVVERMNLSSQLLEILAVDKYEPVREKAMINPNLSKEAVERILCGEYATEYLKRNSNFPSDNPDSLTAILNHYAKSQSWLVSYIALCQPQISQDLLQEKSRSISWLERFAVAQNPQTSLEILKQLAEDSNQLVRAAARNLQRIASE